MPTERRRSNSKIAPDAALTARPRRKLKRGRNHSPIFSPTMPTHPSATNPQPVPLCARVERHAFEDLALPLCANSGHRRRVANGSTDRRSHSRWPCRYAQLHLPTRVVSCRRPPRSRPVDSRSRPVDIRHSPSRPRAVSFVWRVRRAGQLHIGDGLPTIDHNEDVRRHPWRVIVSSVGL